MQMPLLSPAQCVIRAFGGVRKTAKAVGRQPGAVTQWKRHGLVPPRIQLLVLRMAQEGKIVITAEELIAGSDLNK